MVAEGFALGDNEFEGLKASLRYETEDLFTHEKLVYPLIWKGRKLVGVDWSHPIQEPG